MFGTKLTLAAFRWVDEELSALPPEAPFAKWWSSRRVELESRLPESVTQGSFPRSLPDRFKPDLSRFVLLDELLYELTHGPADGREIWTGDTLLGTLPPLDGGWGDHPIWVGDVLRWFRRWRYEMESDLGEMIADVQLLTDAPDLEVAPGVRMRINPERLAQLRADGAANPLRGGTSVSGGLEARDSRPLGRSLGRVLIVEPHAGVREGLVRFLGSSGFSVVGTAEDGAEAIRLVGELRPDAVTTEINVPGMDGLTMAGIIREQFPRVQVVILTTRRDEHVKQKAMAAGAAAYLAKADIQPADAAEALHDVIENAARQSRPEDPRT